MEEAAKQREKKFVFRKNIILFFKIHHKLYLLYIMQLSGKVSITIYFMRRI